jgi:hypothetical protein
MKTITALATGTLLCFATAFAPIARAQAAATPPSAAQPGMTGFDKVVSVATLPTVDEIMRSVPQGSIVERIEQSPTQVVVFYRASSGATSKEAFVRLPQAGVASTAPSAPIAPAPAPPPPAVTGAPPATVYYTQPAPVYAYPDYSYYSDPYYYGYPYPYPYLFPFGGIGVGIRLGGHFGGGFGGGFRRR